MARHGTSGGLRPCFCNDKFIAERLPMASRAISMTVVGNRALKIRARRLAPAFTIVVLTWGTSLFFLWPGKFMLPAGALSSACFLLAQLFPKCSFSRRPLVTPLNWIQFIFGLQLVIMPASVRLAGPALYPLPSLPSDLAINISLLISTAAFLAFCGAVQFFRKDVQSNG